MKTKKPFDMERYDNSDKSIYISENYKDGWGALQISIDYDDVDRDVIEIKAEKLLDILNKHWNER